MKLALGVGCAGGALLLGALTTTAVAQTTNEAAAGVQEIVVTAERRAERLQDTPIAITAFTGDALEQRSVDTLDRVASFTPNIRFDSSPSLSGAKYAATVYIRGIGQNDFAVSTDAGVGIYVDGVYYSRSVGAIMDTVDLERVEILRGPQGTLFGRNTIGGAVSVTTAKPDEEFGGRLQATVGSLNRLDLSGAVNIPVSDTFLTRFSFASFTRDGWQDRIAPKFTDNTDPQGDRNTQVARGQASWLATDRFTIDFSADYTKTRETSTPLSLLAVAPAPGLTGVPFLTTFNATVASSFGVVAPNGLRTYNASFVTGDPDRTYATGHNVNNLDLWGVGATASWDLGSVELKNILAYRDMQAEFGRDSDGSPFTYREGIVDANQNQFSEEFQISHASDRLKWVAGLYYFEEEGRDYSFLDIATGSPIVVTQDNDVRAKSTTYAAFGQATLQMTDQWAITVGARINKDEKEISVRNETLSGTVISAARSGDWTSFTPMARLEFEPTDDILLYATYSNGFKSGGFNSRPVVSAAEVTEYKPEEAEAFEIGAKTSWFDNRLTLNAAAYLTNYTDIQQSIIMTPQVFIGNAAEAEIKGFELELNARPVRALSLNLSVGHTDAEYTELGAGLGQGQILPITLASKFPKVPRWTISGGVELTQDLANLGELIWRVDASHFSEYFNDAANTRLLMQPSYTTVNANLTFSPLDQPWRLSAFVTNATDERYIVSGNTSSAIGVTEATFSDPRQFGVRLGVNF